MELGAEPVRIVEKAWERAYKVQQSRNSVYTRIWQRYKGFHTNVRNPYRSNLVMPKLYTAIETLAPRIGKALFGKRPYIPMRSEMNPDAAKVIETVLDTYLYREKFKIKGVHMIKGVALFGTYFLEPLPESETIVQRRMVMTPMGMPAPVEEAKQRFKLSVRRYMPWQVYVEPHMTDLTSPGYAIVLDIVPKAEIIRLIMAGRYPGVDPERILRGDPNRRLNIPEEMKAALNIMLPEEDSDYGILMRYQDSDGQWITAWNLTVALEQRENPFAHKKINLVRCAWNEDPMLQNSFWGQPESKAIEAIMDKLDESWNTTFDNHDLINQPMIGFRDQAVNPHQIVAAGGARIRIKGNFSGSIREAIDTIPIQGLPPDAYNIPAILDREVDRAMGVHAPQRGEVTQSGDTTATEISVVASQGDLRNEARADILSSMGLADFADKSCSIIDQFTAFDDLFEIVGMEAMLLPTMNPGMVPGGVDYQFRGADTIINDYQKRADMREAMQILQNNPAVRPDGSARKFLESFGWGMREINEMVYTPEEMQAMAQQQQAAMDEERAKELMADVVLAREGAKAKGEAQRQSKATGRTGAAKRQSAARKPTQGNTAGVRT